ncbi:hypothetical protein JCM10213_008080 [Rhodosporidiobolus nylandii]
MATPDIEIASPQGQALQAAIQKQLAVLGWSTEDDAVMAEYCLVMLGNRKTAEQISTELSDLIGGDFDASFVTWLFDEVKKHYPPANAPPANAPTGPSSSSPAGPKGVPSRPAAPLGSGRNVFGAAVGGVKRDARELDGAAAQDGRQQRQRFDAPTGPRNAGGQQGGRSLFDRVNGNNPQFAPGRNAGPVNNTGMPQAAFDAITQAVNAVLSGAHPSVLANVPFPLLAGHPASARLPPLVMQQAQANAMAQAQALAAIQNVWNSPAGAFGAGAGAFGAAPAAVASGFNPNAAAFNPAGGAGGRPPRPQAQKPAAPPVVLPSKPEQEAICKHGVDCTKPQCPFSHPSPVATKESGLVLSSEACEKQLKCEDPDCSKSHVSRAQLTSPPSAVSAGTTTLAPAAPPRATASPAGQQQGTPCKFGAACTRPGCYFVHPWDVSGVPSGSAAGGTPCRYGAGCTRADCHFSHPPGRSASYSRKTYSATFNKSSTTLGAKKAAQPSGIGAWPSESKEHVSDRLKRFSGGANGDGAEKDGDVERIVPGEQKEHKVEIHLHSDDEDEVKKEDAAKEAEKPAAAA